MFMSLERELETARAELSRSVGVRARFEQRRPSRSRREGALPEPHRFSLNVTIQHAAVLGSARTAVVNASSRLDSRTRLIRSAAVRNAGSAAGMAALGARGGLQSAACPPYCDAGSSAGRGLTWPAFCSTHPVAPQLRRKDRDRFSRQNVPLACNRRRITGPADSDHRQGQPLPSTGFAMGMTSRQKRRSSLPLDCVHAAMLPPHPSPSLHLSRRHQSQG